MLRRISDHNDPALVTVVPLRPRLEAAPRTGLGLPALSVGRHPSNDVVLSSTGIPLLLSRYHSAITFDGEQFTLVDKSNTNGTYVNAVQLPHLGQRILRVGDVVSFGGPANVVREGVSLQNPFRFVFEEYSSSGAAQEAQQAVAQTVEPASQPEGDQAQTLVPEGGQTTFQPPVVAATAQDTGEAGELPAQPTNGSRSRRRRREDDVGVAVSPAPQPGERAALEEGRPARRARASPSGAPAPPVAAPQALAGAAGTHEHGVQDASVADAGRIPEVSAPPAVEDDEAGLPPAVPRSVAPLESDDIGAVYARLIADAKCSVCFELMVAPHALTCGHSFCGACITAWMRKNPCCPVCRARTSAPAYERALDDILAAIVEPRMPADEAAERHQRKVQWAASQRELARAQRAMVAAAGHIASRGRGNLMPFDRLPVHDLHRLVRTTEQLQQEVSRLHTRMGTASGATNTGPDAVEGAPAGDAPASAAVFSIAVRMPGASSPRMVLVPSGMEGLLLPAVRPLSAARARAIAAAAVPQPAPVTVEWRIDAAPTGLCVCHTCYHGIAQEDARVVHTTQQPSPVGAQARGDARLPPQTARAFFHLGCRLPPLSADVVGLDHLPHELRVRVDAVLAARAAHHPLAVV